MDPNNGEIICMVSKPDYDLNVFSGKLSPQVWAALNTDPDKPLFNRATQTKYPPGSTYKMVSALASLQEGIMKPNSTIVCEGSFRYGDKVFGDHGAYGSIGFTTSAEHLLMCSIMLVLKIGFDNWTKYGKLLGFGDKTGIDIPEETKGLLLSPAYFDKVYGRKDGLRIRYFAWYWPGWSLVFHPQMAGYCSTISNGGIYYQPHFCQVFKLNTGELTPISYKKRELPARKRNISRLSRKVCIL
jgi:penicillin-binding protein 2